MTDKTIDLDQHRGMAAQKATDLRRLLADVEANERSLRLRQDELESHLIAAPAASWQEAAEKARYLLNLFAATLTSQDPRRQKLIAAVLADFERLSGGRKLLRCGSDAVYGPWHLISPTKVAPMMRRCAPCGFGGTTAR